MTAANRGKVAEGKVREHLAKLNDKRADFDFERVLDAHAAGGRFNARTGDFAWWSAGLNGVIEVKEVAHDYRLPHKNATPESVAKLRKRSLAGGAVHIAVYHSTTKLWRSVPLSVLLDRSVGGSWELSEYPTFNTVKELFAGTVLAL